MNRIQLSGDFLSQQDIDIVLLQEVTTTNLTCIRNYTVHDNIRTEGRGTPILSKTGISITDVTRIPSGRSIAANLFGTRIVNIFAPSGAEKSGKRTVLLERDNTTPTNQTLRPTACFWFQLYTKPFWQHRKWIFQPIFRDTSKRHGTHWFVGKIEVIMATQTTLQNRRLASTGSIYRDRSHKKSGIETCVVACTDHLAVVRRMGIDGQIPTIGRGYWKMNTSLLNSESFVAELKSCWPNGKNTKNIIPILRSGGADIWNGWYEHIS